MCRAFPHGVLVIYSVCANSLLKAWGNMSVQRAAEPEDGQPQCTGSLTGPGPPLVKGTGIFRCHRFLSFTGLGKGFEKSHEFLGRIEAF